jgi:hypothetical protein
MAKKNREKRKIKIRSAADRLAKHTSSGFERTVWELPEGFNSWIPPKQEAVWDVDIIPYKVGEGNPYAQKGDYYYERTFWTHRSVGPNQDSYVCLRTFKKPCPICQYRAKLKKQGAEEEVWKALNPKQRQLFNVFVHKEPDKGVQILEISFHNFGDYLDAKIRKADESKRIKYERFYDPEKGYTLRLGASVSKMGKNEFVEFNDIEFKKRQEPLDEATLDETACLDDLLIEKDYDELKKILLQTGSGKKKKKGDDDGDEDEDEEDEEADEDDEDSDDEETDDSDDDEDEEDEDETDQESEDEDGDKFEVGDKVSFVYKGKKKTGKIKKINSKKGLAQIKVPGQERLSVVELDELMTPKGGKKDEEEDEWDQADDDSEDDSDEGDDSTDDDEDEDDQGEGSDEEDQDVDDDEPKPKKKRKKR